MIRKYTDSLSLASHFYRSPNIDRMIKSNRIKSAGHVARMEMGEGTSAFKILTSKLTGKRPRTILKWIVQK